MAKIAVGKAGAGISRAGPCRWEGGGAEGGTTDSETGRVAPVFLPPSFAGGPLPIRA